MPFQFPDPSVSTTATLPNGEEWEYVNGAWQAVAVTDNDQAQIDALIVDDQEQADEIAALQQAEIIDRQLLINITSRVEAAEADIENLEGLDISSAISLLQIARQDIIELKSKVESLELTSFLLME